LACERQSGENGGENAADAQHQRDLVELPVLMRARVGVPPLHRLDLRQSGEDADRASEAAEKQG